MGYAWAEKGENRVPGWIIAKFTLWSLRARRRGAAGRGRRLGGVRKLAAWRRAQVGGAHETLQNFNEVLGTFNCTWYSSTRHEHNIINY